MPLQTATNPKTGERVVLVGDQWQPFTQTATNKAGQKAYLVGDQWLTDEAPAPAPAPAEEAAPIDREVQNLLSRYPAKPEAKLQPFTEFGRGVMRAATAISPRFGRT